MSLLNYFKNLLTNFGGKLHFKNPEIPQILISFASFNLPLGYVNPP